MINAEHDIVQRIEQAQRIPEAADAFLESYMPFIKAQTAKFIKRIPQEENDDELCIAMFAFYEAMMHYDKAKGAFLKFAEKAIRNRLVDYFRKEQRHKGNLSLEQPVFDGAEESEHRIMDELSDNRYDMEKVADQMATGEEIQHFNEQLQEFGITLTEVAQSCPKQGRTLDICMEVLEYARQNTDVLEQLVKNKKLPIQQICEGTGVHRKTIERHRKYIVAILLAFTNGFVIIRGHLRQMKRKEEAL